MAHINLKSCCRIMILQVLSNLVSGDDECRLLQVFHEIFSRWDMNYDHHHSRNHHNHHCRHRCCNQVGSWSAMTGYGLAFPLNSKHKAKFNEKLLEYRFNGNGDGVDE